MVGKKIDAACSKKKIKLEHSNLRNTLPEGASVRYL